MYRRRGLKVNADKSKRVLGGKEVLQCEIRVDGERLEQASRVQIFGVYFR